MRRWERLVRRAARLLAEEIVAAVERRGGIRVAVEDPVRLDVADAIAQMGTGEANVALQRFYSWNHRWVANLAERNRRTAEESYDFIEENMADAVYLLDQFAYLDSKRERLSGMGNDILDLGVHTGNSTRRLARLFPEGRIHGFDSFEGLPEDWTHTTAGEFKLPDGAIPDMPGNVTLYKGWFEETLPAWRRQHPDPHIALLRVDCDLYSSTKTAFDVLGDLLGPGSWILFDELIGYRGWRDHEYKALQEFLSERSLGVRYLAYGLTYTLVELTEAE